MDGWDGWKGKGRTDGVNRDQQYLRRGKTRALIDEWASARQSKQHAGAAGCPPCLRCERFCGCPARGLFPPAAA